MKKTIKLFSGTLATLALSGIASASFITSSSDSALAGANVIDFEDQTIGTYTSLTVDDVTFTAVDNHLQIDNSYQQYNQSGIYLDNGTYSDNGFGTLNIEIAGGTDAFGFTWGMAESFATWELSAYDGSDNLIEAYVLPSTQSSNLGEFFGIAAANIAYATLSWTGDYDWIAIDNFSYTSSIPEPATLGLLTLGLLGLGMCRRKQVAAS